MDRTACYASYRHDGWGRSASEPAMLVSLLLSADCGGERSSRQIERRCREDSALRVLTANPAPDHAAIARFRQWHEQALAGLFVDVLRLCAEAGLLRANASRERNRAHAAIEAEVRAILGEAERVDAKANERWGTARGDELPEGLRVRRSGWRGCAPHRNAWRPASGNGRSATKSGCAHERRRTRRGRQPNPPQADPEARVHLTDRRAGWCATPAVTARATPCRRRRPASRSSSRRS